MGCGEMPYLPLLENYLQKLYAVDLPGNPKANYFVDLDTNRTDIADEEVDIVWSVMVLEHVSDPQKYLEECRRILKPGGKLILCTHGHWMFHPDPVDFWRWTSQGLAAQVERGGFTVKEFWGMMGLLSMSVQLFQDAGLLHMEDLTQALVDTGATLAFDATGGGKLAGQILTCMIDSLVRNRSRLTEPEIFSTYRLNKKDYFLMTLHRPSNVDEPEVLDRLLQSITRAIGSTKLIFPVHPRTQKRLEDMNYQLPGQLILVEPLRYLEFIYLVEHG